MQPATPAHPALPKRQPPGAGQTHARPLGVIPGGGGGTRLGPLPCSKELLPIGWRHTPGGPRPKVVAHYLLDGLLTAEVEQVFWLIDRKKGDIVEYFGNGKEFGATLAYVPTHASPSVLHTLDSAHGFLRGRAVLFGFPDIIFDPPDAPRHVWQRLVADAADVVLGAVPAPPEQIADRIRVAEDGAVLEIAVKPVGSTWPLAWLLAAWSPRFTDFVHGWLRTRPAAEGELYLSHAVQAALQSGLRVTSEVFPSGSFVDAGTPSGWASALNRYGPDKSR